MGAEVRVHDPYVDHWWEMEKQDGYPTHNSWARFFRNQEGLKNLQVTKELPEALHGADAVVLAVRHQPYLDLDPGAGGGVDWEAGGR